MSNRLLRMGRGTVAFATMAALVLFVAVWSTSSIGYAYASESSTKLQATAVCTSHSGRICSTAAVQKTYPAKRTMVVKMAGGDVTTIATTKTGGKVKWKSSNNKIAKVVSTGKYTAKVTALKPGKATITAKTSSQTLTCKITVTGALNKRSVALTPLQTAKLKLSGAKVKSWKSSNKKVVSVSNGTLTPITSGKATITCTDKAGYKYTCAVTVQKPSITCKVTGLLPESNSLSFSLANKSNKDITLNTSVLYYPSTSFNYNVALNAFSATNSLKVKRASTANFTGTYNSTVLLWNSGYLKLGFKVGEIQYLAMFSPISGTILACGRI